MANKAKTALLCAYTLARAGQYAEAEALILSHDELSKTPEAIDLLARIRIEEGDEAEARRLWQSIQTIYPEYQPARNALKVIGKRQFRFRWWILAVIALPICFALGLLMGTSPFFTRAQERTVCIDWETLPTAAKINELSAYKGTTARVCVTSHFFATPDKLFSRAILTEYIGQALELPPEAIFIGSAPEDFAPEAIRVELLQRNCH